MDINTPLALLGGLTASQFMRKHWHKSLCWCARPSPASKPHSTRTSAGHGWRRWCGIAPDPATRWWQLEARPRPAVAPQPACPEQAGLDRAGAGVDMHDAKVHELLQQFRFVPEARLDDLMISFATDQGGVGPHFDSYDVFLLQAHGSAAGALVARKTCRCSPISL